jgi:hypothetical protein
MIPENKNQGETEKKNTPFEKPLGRQESCFLPPSPISSLESTKRVCCEMMGFQKRRLGLLLVA